MAKTYSHIGKPSGEEGLFVGVSGSEVQVASSTGGLYQSGTAITASAAELNLLDGVTATTAELNLIDGSVAGTAVASKALALGADKNVDVLAVADLKLGAGAGTSVTSTAAELNILDGVTMTAAQINLLAQGVGASYKVARGVSTIDAASKDVATGLTTVVAVVVSMVGDPSLTHMHSSGTVGDQAGAPAAGSIRIKSWKPTATGDVTPIAATSPFGNVAWIAIGT